MRISDWSSDVCSSDLPRRNEHPRKDHAALDIRIGRRFPREAHVLKALARTDASLPLARYLRRYCPQMAAENSAGRTRAYLFSPPPPAHSKNLLRSEEHTSELQSLMRNSYAVFCLKKKKTTNTTTKQ